METGRWNEVVGHSVMACHIDANLQEGRKGEALCCETCRPLGIYNKDQL